MTDIGIHNHLNYFIMETLQITKNWNTKKVSIPKGVKAVSSAYENQMPYLTKSKICCICGTSSDVISM